MQILIAKSNEQLIQSIYGRKKIKFSDSASTKRFDNASCFNLNKKQFGWLCSKICDKGYNPFDLLSW